MKTWFVSDTHFGHTNIIRPEYCDRPFKTESGDPDTEFMNREMIRRWNEVVAEDDKVFHLGDFAMGPKASHKYFFDRLKGYKILVRGNHDQSHEKMLAMGWNEVCTSLFQEIDGYKVYMAHIPLTETETVYEGRTYKPEFTPDPPPYYDIWLCGHVHDRFARRGKVINVGVDVRGFRPVSFQELLETPDPS